MFKELILSANVRKSQFITAKIKILFYLGVMSALFCLLIRAKAIYNESMLLIFLIQSILRICLYPFFVLAYIVRIPFFYERIAFERRNYREEGARPFARVGKKADCLFHFSSEGEFEQIRPLADEMISLGKNIEFIFTSPSVESKVCEYYRSNKERVRYLRLPILIYFPLLSRQNVIAWSSANKMMMVRYDFFPELIYLGTKMKEFILFSATIKNSKSQKISIAKKFIYNQFNRIICASKKDFEQFSALASQGEFSLEHTRFDPPIELRMLQINSRQNSFRKHKFYEEFNSLISLYRYEKRICLAQLWPIELDIFKDQDLVKLITGRDLFVFVAPHKLSQESVETFINSITESCPQLVLYHLSQETLDNGEMAKLIEDFQMSPGIILCTVKGVLCELYPYFEKVFVGGGHGKGVHSLLEPYVAGASIYCGPNIHRSTEYDTIINNGQEVTILNNFENVMAKFISPVSNRIDNKVLAQMLKESELSKKKLIQSLTK